MTGTDWVYGSLLSVWRPTLILPLALSFHRLIIWSLDWICAGHHRSSRRKSSTEWLACECWILSWNGSKGLKWYKNADGSVTFLLLFFWLVCNCRNFNNVWRKSKTFLINNRAMLDNLEQTVWVWGISWLARKKKGCSYIIKAVFIK